MDKIFTEAEKKKQDKILSEIKSERRRQRIKWGDQSYRSPENFLSILVEEIGEVGRAIYEENYEGTDSYRSELIQVAAVCVQMVEVFDKLTQAEINFIKRD